MKCLNIKIKKLMFFFLLISSYCFADSPLTSVTFWQVYKNDPIVNKAAQSKNRLNKELSAYLVQENPLCIKLAVINALGWKRKGQHNSDFFLKYILKKFNLKKIDELNNAKKSDILVCFAYMKAMDNYFDVSEAYKMIKYLKERYEFDPFYGFAYSLIATQNILNNDLGFCNIYNEAKNFQPGNQNLKHQEVWNIYYSYFESYKSLCK